MPTYIAHGGKDTVITSEEKRSLLHEALLKLGGIPKKILVIPPDITRLHSNAGELTQILYALWDPANGTTFDILPAIGTHAPMTEAQIAEMYGNLPKATYHVHNWRTGLYHFGEVPSEFVQEVSGGKLDYSIPVAVNRRLVEGDYELIISVGQVIPHEVIGIANGFKNILVGAGGVEMINKSHFLGAVDGMERLMGRTDTSVRRVLNYAHTYHLKQLGILYVMSVMDTDPTGERVMRGLYVGDDAHTFETAAELSRATNMTFLDAPLAKVVVYLDPIEFKKYVARQQGDLPHTDGDGRRWRVNYHCPRSPRIRGGRRNRPTHPQVWLPWHACNTQGSLRKPRTTRKPLRRRAPDSRQY